jgi:hypothetical protein
MEKERLGPGAFTEPAAEVIDVLLETLAGILA